MIRAQKAWKLYIKQKVKLYCILAVTKTGLNKGFRHWTSWQLKVFYYFFRCLWAVVDFKKTFQVWVYPYTVRLKLLVVTCHGCVGEEVPPTEGKTKKQNLKQKLLKQELPTPITDWQTDRQTDRENKHIAQNKFDKFIKWEQCKGNRMPLTIYT